MSYEVFASHCLTFLRSVRICYFRQVSREDAEVLASVPTSVSRSGSALTDLYSQPDPGLSESDPDFGGA